MKSIHLEPYFVISIILITLLLNLTTFLYRSFTTPPGRFYLGTQFYSDDYAVYLSYIRQGQQGRWTIVDKFTTEPHPASLVHEEYLLWGKLTGVFGISPIPAYHLFRLLLGLAFLAAIYFFLLKIFPDKNSSFLRLLSFALLCLAGGFLAKDGLPYLSWLTETDLTQRFAPLPHYLIGFISQLAIFIWFIATPRKKLVIPAVLGALTAFVSPATFVIIVTTLILYTLANRSKTRALVSLIVLALSGLPAFLYYRSMFTISPWSHILSWEQANKGSVPFIEFFLALGPISFLSFLGIFAYKKYRQTVTFLFIWIVVALAWGFFLADLARLNPTRFFQNPVYIPMAILTVLGLTHLLKKTAFVLITLLLLISITLPTTVASFKNQFQMYADHSELIYPGQDLISAFQFLQAATSPDQPVLTLYMAGNLIPFLSGNTVYLGHLQETLNYPQKVDQANRFFASLLSSPDAQKFLKDNHIQLVFSSPQEQSLGGKIDQYSFLKPIYHQGPTTIFRVQ